MRRPASSPSRPACGCLRYHVLERAAPPWIRFVYFFGGLVLDGAARVPRRPSGARSRTGARGRRALWRRRDDQPVVARARRAEPPPRRRRALCPRTRARAVVAALRAERRALVFHGLNHFVLFRTIGSVPARLARHRALFLDAAPAAAAAARPSRASLLPLYVTAAPTRSLVPLRHHWPAPTCPGRGSSRVWLAHDVHTTDGFLFRSSSAACSSTARRCDAPSTRCRRRATRIGARASPSMRTRRNSSSRCPTHSSRRRRRSAPRVGARPTGQLASLRLLEERQRPAVPTVLRPDLRLECGRRPRPRRAPRRRRRVPRAARRRRRPPRTATAGR